MASLLASQALADGMADFPKQTLSVVSLCLALGQERKARHFAIHQVP